MKKVQIEVVGVVHECATVSMDVSIVSSSGEMKRVVITGIGVISPFGVGLECTWKGVCSTRSALRRVPEQYGCSVIGSVPEGTGGSAWDIETAFRTGERRQMSRSTLMALTIVREAIAAGGELDPLETGVSIGVGIADLAIMAETNRLLDQDRYNRISPYFVPRILANTAAGEVSMRLGLRGPLMTPSTACSTGVQAIGEAAIVVRTGLAKRMIAGGVESCLDPLAIAGFARLRALSSCADPAIASRPFHRDRDGFVLSEGGALLLLETLEEAEARSASIFAEIVGFGMAGDAHHITAPHPDGIGAKLCMQRALRDAGLQAEQVEYVNAHATSTPIGDLVEARAIAAVLPGTSVSTIKGHIGHTLAGAGAIETAITAMAIRDRVMPGTLSPDDQTDVDADVHLLRQAKDWTTKKRRVALCNSFGFGGSNASICLAEYPRRKEGEE